MTSAIDVTVPIYGNPTTKSVRDNFVAAHDEIGALQNDVATKVNKTGDTMLGFLELYLDPELPKQAATKNYVDSKLGSGSGGARNNARLQSQWVSGAVVANGTVWLSYDAPYAGVINVLKYFTDNGSFVISIQINGTNVTGLTNITVNNTTENLATATAANTFNAGAKITVVITDTTGAPTNALLSLAVTWS